MRFGEALKEALKYHAKAIVPTLIGVTIAFVSLWIGIIDPLLSAITGELGEPAVALERAVEADYGLGTAVIGVIVGLLIRRIGRTALLFKTHGNAVVEEVDREVIPGALVNASTSPNDDPTGGPSSRYTTETDESATSDESLETSAHERNANADDAIAGDDTDDEDDVVGEDETDDEDDVVVEDETDDEDDVIHEGDAPDTGITGEDTGAAAPQGDLDDSTDDELGRSDDSTDDERLDQQESDDDAGPTDR